MSPATLIGVVVALSCIGFSVVYASVEDMAIHARTTSRTHARTRDVHMSVREACERDRYLNQ